MKNIILLITSIALANLAGAADQLKIAPAHALPDYTKLIAAEDTPNRIFIDGFAVGDFNKDGRLDLVVQTGNPPANFWPWGAQVLLQEANGTFTKGIEQILPNTGITWDFVPRDFNEDGNLDILMEDADNDMVMMLGNGDGTFQPAQFLGLSAAGFFAVADLDGDKHLDIVAGKLDGTVGVFAGAGDGTFRLQATLDTLVEPSYPRRGEILIRDLNGDGKPDVVVASILNGNGRQPGNLDVFLGNGDGTFQDVVRTPGVAVRRGALGDFNGDGVLDYAGDRENPEHLEIWLGTGGGHFAKGTTYSLSDLYAFAYGVKVGDVNFDGILDVIVGGERSIAGGDVLPSAPLSIFLGKGDGTFRPRIAFTQANGLMPINTGPQLVDFNGDGFLDILSLCWLGSDWNTVRLAMTISLSQGVKRDPTKGFLLQVQNDAPGAAAPVTLESSANLLNWIALATNTTATASWPFVDTIVSSPHRFYRTRRP